MVKRCWSKGETSEANDGENDKNEEEQSTNQVVNTHQGSNSKGIITIMPKEFHKIQFLSWLEKL